ncbi:MAG: rRNA pseudouridine synthase [Candidatus Marinimicrobia bacterium]|jgi:pseudouridine synthase|nr:rRNA pseudouridine synthase [Candidatus Neomarinimicrobiota bacterium]MBT3496363.1 rRNA pseudouridine synthase [Candidatus Neomarinimicrobiota bacterium]MBT3692574.1 rRNA pseudouridine synthase [Candidatus Neomarinimicrobiota bacterium]MBT3731993.1 rRNA pseudouridine synthase [Candidatus Neomarinimicrobiota bacterium]MBT4145212.1 rRNA pseudouridine synthase [Candidatus Neomarinimicrobiota bacterium]
MRLNKYLSKCGIASRRESDELIQRGTTTVNGKMVLDPALSVSDADVIKYDGKTIKPINYRLVLMLNKPKNVITTVKDTHNRRTVMEYVPSNVRVVPVGRLDKDTTGLLLLTNDGDLLQFLSHPKNRIPREYVAEITGIMTPIQIAKLKKGIYIGDGEYGRAEIVSQKKNKGRSDVILRLRQGKKREIRRMYYHLGIKLHQLKRIKFGPITMKNIKIGEFRALTEEELSDLDKLMKK